MDKVEFETPEQVIDYFAEREKKLERRYEQDRAELALDFKRSMEDLHEAKISELSKFPPAPAQEETDYTPEEMHEIKKARYEEGLDE